MTVPHITITLFAGGLLLACTADPGSGSRRLPAYDPDDPCIAHHDKASCDADLAAACTWVSIGAPCVPGEPCPGGICVQQDPCRVHADEADCVADVELGCAWNDLSTTDLCVPSADGDSCLDGVCYQPSGGDDCACACPLYCPEGAECPPCECDCPPDDGAGDLCSCACPECPPGSICPPCECECDDDPSGDCTGDTTCTCEYPPCPADEPCPPPSCDCGCADGGGDGGGVITGCGTVPACELLCPEGTHHPSDEDGCELTCECVLDA